MYVNESNCFLKTDESREPLLSAEASHLLVHQKPEKEIPRDYFVPDFGIDQDIIDSDKHMSYYEKKWPIGTNSNV